MSKVVFNMSVEVDDEGKIDTEVWKTTDEEVEEEHLSTGKKLLLMELVDHTAALAKELLLQGDNDDGTVEDELPIEIEGDGN